MLAKSDIPRRTILGPQVRGTEGTLIGGLEGTKDRGHRPTDHLSSSTEFRVRVDAYILVRIVWVLGSGWRAESFCAPKVGMEDGVSGPKGGADATVQCEKGLKTG